MVPNGETIKFSEGRLCQGIAYNESLLSKMFIPARGTGTPKLNARNVLLPVCVNATVVIDPSSAGEKLILKSPGSSRLGLTDSSEKMW